MTFWENPKKCLEIFKKYIQNVSKIKNRQKNYTLGACQTDRHTDGQKIATPYNEKLEETGKGKNVSR